MGNKEGIPGPAIITLASGKKIMWRRDENYLDCHSLLGGNFSRVAWVVADGTGYTVMPADDSWPIPSTDLMTNDLAQAKRIVEVMYTLVIGDAHKEHTSDEIKSASRVAAQLTKGDYNDK